MSNSSPSLDRDYESVLPPVSLAERRRTRHLSALLAQRARFAAITAEKEAHGVLDAHDHLQWLIAIEQAIEEQWPSLYWDLLPDWAREDASLMHNPPRRHPDCGICTGAHLGDPTDQYDTHLPLAA